MIAPIHQECIMVRIKTGFLLSGPYSAFRLARRYLLAGFLIALLIAPVSCNQKESIPDPMVVFTETENAIQQYYYFKDLESFSLDALYLEALEAIGKPPEENRTPKESLIAAIKGAPEDQKKDTLHNALRAFMEALPKGKNDFVKAESLALASDPEKVAGTGLILRKEGPGKFFVIDRLEDSSSAREDIHTGVYLEAVDGEALSDIEDLEYVVGKIKGQENSEIEIQMGGKTFSLLRTKSNFRNILTSAWSGDGGKKVEYIVVRTTLKGSAAQLRQHLMGMGQRQAVILDMRRLYTGEYEEAFAVADLFTPVRKLGGVEIRGKENRTFEGDPDRIFTGPVYVITGKHSSPFAYILASVLSKNENVTIAGNQPDTEAMISRQELITGGIQLRIISGAVLDETGSPLYKKNLKIDISVEEYLSSSKPESAPDLKDPAQKKLSKLLL